MERIVSFVLYSVKVLYCIAFWMLNQFCVPETNPQLPFEGLDCELHRGYKVEMLRSPESRVVGAPHLPPGKEL